MAGSEPRAPIEKGLSEGQRFVLTDREADLAREGPLWLADPKIAAIVKERLIAGSLTLYTLAAGVVMANHVHIVILPQIPLRRIMQRFKGITAHHANKALGRTGTFWKDESYDHWIRSADELNRVIRYVERNPVTAGLVNSVDQWQWSSAWASTD